MRTAACLPILAALSAAAADPKAKPIPGLKDAQDRYAAALAKAKKEHDQAAKDATEFYVASLKDIQAERTKAGDLDGAVRVRDLIAEAGADNPAPVGGDGFQLLGVFFVWYDQWKDVTANAKKFVKNGELKLATAGEAVGAIPDIAPNQHKTLVVVYRHKGAVRVAIGGDDKPLLVPGR